MTSSQNSLEAPGFQVLEYLGKGARSTIWKVQDTRTEQILALKRVVKSDASEQRYLEQAENEYEVGSQLDHSGIRRIYELRRRRKWFSTNEIHLLMEFCPGQSIQQDRPEDVREIARIFTEVASALAYMNAAGFVHADMKPNNILVGPQGGVKVIDLGQSCPIGTVKKRIQGTPDFIAPEQVRREPLDERTDVYNFGASLYWTLVGIPIPTILPKNGGTGVTFLQDLDIQPPHEANPEIPLSISRLTMDCLHLQPRQRLESMKTIADRMELLAASRALDVTPDQVNGGA